jgi:beta-lactamase regulating signal transducer with metallopeptidase domain
MLIPWRYERTAQIPELIPIPLPDVHILDNMILGKNIIVSGIAKGASENIQGLNISFDEALLYTWLIGAVLLGLYTLFRNMRFWIRIKKLPMLIDREVLDLLEECRTRMKINTIAGITITDLVESPAMFGYLRPRLLLPQGVLEKLTKAELTFIFMHELGHLKRHDIGISWIITFLQVFHWFNPFVWLAFYQMRIDQESACDASVLSKIRHNQSKDYADTIIGFLEKFCQNSQLPAMAGIIENKSQMKRRIAMIVRYRKSTKKITIAAVIMLLVTGFAFYTLTGFAQEKEVNSNETGLFNELSDDAKVAMVKAQELYEVQDFTSARIPLLDYIAAKPDKIPVDVYLMLGYYWYIDRNILKDKALDEALKVFEEGYDTYPDNSELMAYYAAVLYETGYFAEAAPLFEKLYEKYNKSIRYLEAAYGAYYMAGNLDDAKRVLKELIGLPGNRFPKSQWILALYKIGITQGDMDDAKNALQKYINEVKNPDPALQSILDNINNGMADKKIDIDITVHKSNNPLPLPESDIEIKKPSSAETEKNGNSINESVYKLTDVDMPPRVIRAVRPKYPSDAGTEGMRVK